jgi:outer membrane receptor protein involved in Fe transport
MLKQKFARKSAFLMATAVASAVAAQAAMAQDLRLEEVVVTAQKRSQSVTDIPMSIVAFSGENMAEMGVQDTTDIAAVVPGMAYADSPTGTPIYTLRGVGFNESSTQAAATVGVYTDEHAIAYPIMTRGPMLDIERVEVLKGPQGTLYGRNATGGAINFITKKPTEEFEAGVTGSYGRYETASGEGYVSGPVTDWMRARLAVKGVYSNDGWQESASRSDKLGEQDKMSARLGLAFDLGDRGDALLTTSYWKDKSDSIAPQFQAGNYANLGPVADVIRPNEPTAGSIGDDATEAEWMAGRTPSYDMENLSFGLTVNYDLTDTLRLTSLTSYADFDDNGSTFDRAGIAGIPVSEATAPYQNGDIADQTDGYLTNDFTTVTSSIDSFSQELRVSGEYGIATWVAGVYYSENDVDNVANQSFNLSTSTNGLLGGAPVGNFPSIDNTAQQDSTTWAAFASADWLIGDKLTVTTGLRYSDDQIDFKGCTADTGDASLSTFFNVLTGIVSGGALEGNAVPGGCITWDLPTPQSAIGPSGLIKRNLDEDSTSWRLAVNYDVTDDTSVYTSYSRGFKSGSFPTLGASNSNQYKPVKQEQLDAYEIGFKSSLQDGAAQVNGAIFYYDYTDKQLLTKISDPVFGRLFALENVDDSEVWGAEIDALWMPLDGLTLGTAVSWMETEIGQFIGSNQVGDEINFNGSEFPFSSNWAATATAKYEWNLTSNLVGMVAVDANYTGDTVADYKSDDATDTSGNPYQYDSRFDIDSYTLLNARIGVSSADGTWNTFAWGRNLTDEYYYNNVLQASDMLTRYAGNPRTYGVTLEYNW